MRAKEIKITIVLKSDDLLQSEEIACNYLTNEINKSIGRTIKKFNTKMFSVKVLDLISEIEIKKMPHQ